MIWPILIAAVLMLGGCSAVGKLTPEQTTAMIKAFSDAGCGGKIDVGLGAATGQLGGEGHATLELHGECPQKTLPIGASNP